MSLFSWLVAWSGKAIGVGFLLGTLPVPELVDAGVSVGGGHGSDAIASPRI